MTEEINIATVKLSPFDIIKMMFSTDGEFEKLSNLTLEKNYFIINRVFAIKYPFQAECFNNLKAPTAEVVRAWRQFLVSKEGSGKVPYFVYTKGSKRSSESKEVKSEIKESSLKEYAGHYSLSLKDVHDMTYFFYDDMLAEIKRFEKMMSAVEQSKMIQQTKIKK